MLTTFANLHISYNSSSAEGRVVIIWLFMLIINSTFVRAADTAFSIFQFVMYLGINWCWRAIFCLQQKICLVWDYILMLIDLPDQVICILFFLWQTAHLTLTNKVPVLQTNLAL